MSEWGNREASDKELYRLYADDIKKLMEMETFEEFMVESTKKDGGMKTYNITPVPKPRMTQRDRWAKRDCTEMYWAYKDQIQGEGVRLPNTSSYHVIFILPMPRSWSQKKRKEFLFKPHLSRPDKDNLEKGLLDAIYGEDCQVWTGETTKLWGESGVIVIIEKDFDYGIIEKLKASMGVGQ